MIERKYSYEGGMFVEGRWFLSYIGRDATWPGVFLEA